MKKVFYIIIILLVLVLIIGGAIFTKSKKDIKIDISKLIDEIMQNVKFEDEMNEVESDIIKHVYNIENSIAEKGYMSSGATTEEVIIFEFSDSKEAEKSLEKVNARIEDQKNVYESYAPKEVKRLNEAIIKQEGKYIIICVTEDENAEKIIQKNIR